MLLVRERGERKKGKLTFLALIRPEREKDRQEKRKN